jgi:uncharacterized protein YmfQ (DUF2313 family)
MSDKHVRRSGDDYSVAMHALLPQGQAWPRDSESALGKTVRGLCQIWGFVDGRAADLLEIETDPRATTEMLLDWERNWGLPDPCLPHPPTDEQARREELVFKMTLLGRQDRQFFIDYADRLGEVITIREYAPYMCGVSRVGDTRRPPNPPDDPGDPYFRWQLGRPEMRFYWTVELERVDSGVECVLTRYKPAHTDVVFTYKSKLDRSIGLYSWLGI